jgi:hypothetical protein
MRTLCCWLGRHRFVFTWYTHNVPGARYCEVGSYCRDCKRTGVATGLEPWREA